jgi:hypothetical protein
VGAFSASTVPASSSKTSRRASTDGSASSQSTFVSTRVVAHGFGGFETSLGGMRTKC